jgi:hypothetical protein
MNSRIGTGSNHPPRKSIHVQIPNGPLVSVEGPQPLSVFRSPHGGHVVFGGREEEIAVKVEFDYSDGSFVSFEEDWSLRNGSRLIAAVDDIYCELNALSNQMK